MIGCPFGEADCEPGVHFFFGESDGPAGAIGPAAHFVHGAYDFVFGIFTESFGRLVVCICGLPPFRKGAHGVADIEPTADY